MRPSAAGATEADFQDGRQQAFQQLRIGGHVAAQRDGCHWPAVRTMLDEPAHRGVAGIVSAATRPRFPRAAAIQRTGSGLLLPIE